ncbi:MAG TPA: hypothetical protein VFN65_01925 [Solirubrobacteraceae bacterium]|nr:hypothetical protein [Solirubrobacteraceae bacterium]
MSALADGRARDGSRPPGYRSLLLATLPAQVLSALALWVVQLPLALLGVAASSRVVSLWLPWTADGPWSLLAIAGYVLVVCVLGGTLTSSRVADRGIPAPAPAWAWLAFGAAGYGAMALGESGGARLALAAVLAPLTLRLFAYRQDGSGRPWPSRLRAGRRGLVPALVAGVALALSYAGGHAFVQNGSGGPAWTAAPPRSRILAVGLQGIVWPAQVTAAALDGARAGAVVITRAALASESGPALVLGGPAGTSGPVARRLPASLPARAGAWLVLRIRMRSCPAQAPRIAAITLRYRVLDVSTSERIPLWSAMRLACRRPLSG